MIRMWLSNILIPNIIIEKSIFNYLSKNASGHTYRYFLLIKSNLDSVADIFKKISLNQLKFLNKKKVRYPEKTYRLQPKFFI